MWIRRVFSFDSSKFELLLLSLTPEDRRLRFSGLVRDEAIQAYVAKLKWREICVYGMFDKQGTLLGAVELVPSGDETELAIAVLSTRKRQGIGRTLMSRAMLHAKVRGLRKLQILCSAENKAMQHLARGVGMTLTREYGDVAGLVTVERPTTADYMAATWFKVDATVSSSMSWAGGTWQMYRDSLKSLRSAGA